MMPDRLIILDRDGVINEESGNHIKSVAEWKPIPGSLEAIARLTQAGFKIMVATNQAGLALGLFTPKTLQAIHRRLHDAVAEAGGRIDGIFHCPHSANDDCACRKPRPGLLTQIAAELGRSLQDVPFIGDSQVDIDAALAAGAQPHLVLTGNGRHTQANLQLPSGVRVHTDLAAAVTALLYA